MPLTTNTYDELIALIRATCGIGTFTGSERTRIDSLINLAANRIYREYDYWERFLVVGEPRTLERGIIPSSEDSFHVYGAGTDDVNGLYKRNGTANARARYSKYNGDDTEVLWDLEWNGADAWEILVGADNSDLTEDTVYYTNSDTSTTPPTTGWAVDNGTASAPALTDVEDIDTFFRVHLYNPFKRTSGGEVNFFVDSVGCHVQGNYAIDQNVVYVTYKRTKSETYGDGTAGTTATIPGEWFNYMALYTTYMHQQSQKQANGSPGVSIALREVENSLAAELEKIAHQHINDVIARRVKTHYSENHTLL